MLNPKELTSPSLARWWTCDVVTSRLAFAALREEWGALLEDSDASIFNSWEWLHPWHQRIAPERALRIITVRDRAGRLSGLMPLSLETLRVAGKKLRRLCFLGDDHVGSDYLDVVCRRGMEAEVRAVVARYLRDTEAGWDVLDLLDLDSESPTIAALQEVFAEDFESRIAERFICPGDTFAAGEKFDAFLHRTARRDNYLRRRKWLEKQDGYRVERVERTEGLSQAMSHFFRLHAMRWAEDGGSSGIKGPGVEAFHRDATHLLAERGALRMYTMKVGDEAVASVYGIVHRGVFSYYQSGLDPSWRPKSVGLVLIGETFRDSLELGLGRYDFLRGTEKYKSDWTSQRRRTVALRIHKRDGKGAWLTSTELLAKRARDGAKRLLPGAMVERIRRLRRKRAAK